MGRAGTYTAALGVGGGTPSASALTEDWNGVSWAEVADLNTGRSGLGGSGSTTAALAFAGSGPSAATEEWSGSSNTIKVLTD